MAKVSKYEGSEHESASELARRICDLLHDCLPTEYLSQKHFTKSTCGAYVPGRKASLYWLYHYDDHVRVYPYSKHILEMSEEIRRLLPSDVTLQTRRSNQSDWANVAPCFFEIRTEKQAQGMSAVLQFLSDYRSNSSKKIESVTSTTWLQPSESEGDVTHAGTEGNRISVLVNKYERNPKNRKICIRHYGAICKACDFDFSAKYGDIGIGYIHVHHLHPLAGSDGKAKIPDPIKDFRPVCPNCHEMLHRGDPLHPKTIEELKEIIVKVKASNRKLQPQDSGA